MLTLVRLKDALSYDPDTGIFVWINPPVFDGGPKPGTRAGSLQRKSKKVFRTIALDGVTYRADRLAWYYIFGFVPLTDIKHLDGVNNNDSIANLYARGCYNPHGVDPLIG